MVLVYMLTWMGYIDGIHGAPYIAAPWILWDMDKPEFGIEALVRSDPGDQLGQLLLLVFRGWCGTQTGEWIGMYGFTRENDGFTRENDGFTRLFTMKHGVWI